MSYSTIAALKSAVGGDQKYVQLTDRNRTGAADDSIGNAAIAEADALINSYAKSYTIPTAPVPPVIASMSTRLAAWNLRRGTPGTSITAEELKIYELDLQYLDKLAKGEVSFGVQPSPQPSDMIVDEAGERDSFKAITRKKFDGFT